MADADTLNTRRLRPAGRGMAMLAAAAGATPLVIAASLTPAAQGMGTHTTMGLPACGFATMANMPCPTCGMTTAFAWAVRGDLLSSLVAQPMGLLLAIASAMTVLAGLWAALTGAAVQRPLASLFLRPLAGWIVVVLLLAAWGWKIWAWEAGVTP